MEVREIKRAVSFVFLSGFLAGIIYVNIFARTYIVSMGIFSEYFLEQYTISNINVKEFLFYIMRIRLLPFLILAISSGTKYRKLFSGIFVLWTGFSVGLLFTAAMLKMGMKGIGLCIVGILPHFICYIAAYAILLAYLFTYPNTRWNQAKTMSIIIFILLGIISECYINPVILGVYLQLL